MHWEERWQRGDTPWDAGSAVPALQGLIDTGALPAGRALVPGAGSGYDALALGASGYPTLAVDLASSAVERLRELRDSAGLTAQQVEARVADFFEFDPGGPFAVIWDYTFLCALPPARRPDWARRCWDLLADDAELITLVFPVRSMDWPVADADAGPPYPMHPRILEELLLAEERFELLSMEPVEQSHPGREGMEHLGRWRKRAL